MNPTCIVTTTCSDRDVLETISRTLVESRLAACCQISGPITSIYRWEGKIETGEEWVCQIKTVTDHLKTIKAKIKHLHSYDEPEIVMMTIDGGSQSYLDWIRSECSPKGE